VYNGIQYRKIYSLGVYQPKATTTVSTISTYSLHSPYLGLS